MQPDLIYEIMPRHEIEAQLATNANEALWKGLNIKAPLGTSLTPCVGDGTTDDTIALQNAINYCASNGTTLFIPPGHFKITSPLQLPKAIRIRGVNSVYDGYASFKSQCTIDVYSLSAFQPTGGSPANCTIDMEGVYVQYLGGTSGSKLFDNINHFKSLISKNLFFKFDIMFHGTITQVSDIHDNVFEGVGQYFIYHGDNQPTANTIVDSFIHHNYINGNPSNNATCFWLYYPTTSAIHHNYIDFFKIVFNSTNNSQLINITDNVFDYCYKVLMGQYYGVNIQRNLFRNIKSSQALSYFPNADSDMTSKPWTCFENTTFNIQLVNLTDNIIINADQWININGSYNVVLFNSKNNVFTGVTTTIIYNVTKSGNSWDITGIYIEELDNQLFSTLPNPVLTGSGITTFNKQQAYYKGKKIYNNNGIWTDVTGYVVGNIGENVAVSASATSLVVTFTAGNNEADTNYAISVSPQWNTTCWITNKSTSGFTINFGTAPVSASALDWSIKR